MPSTKILYRRHYMNGKFIVCEGLDCSGKTTTIKNALKYFDKKQIIYSKALKSNTIFGKLSRIFPSTFSLLLELLYLDKFFIRPNLKKGKIIIQDRWYHSILSHNPENKKDKFLEKIFIPRLTKPDLLIYFSVSFSERIKRLKKTSQIKDHNILLYNPERIKQKESRYIEHYNNFKGQKEIIDTTNISEKKASDKLYNLIKTIHLNLINPL